MLKSILYPLLPEISLLIFISCGLSVAATSTKLTIIEKKEHITPLIVQLTMYGLVFTAGLIVVSFWQYPRQLCFNAYIITDPYTSLLKIFVLLTTAVILMCSEDYVKNHTRSLLEFPILLLLVVLCLFILLSSYNLIVMFISIIGFSLNIYVLLMTDFKNKAAREAAVKYYYLSTLSSGLLISGILLAYLVFHSTNFAIITWLLHCWTLTHKIKITSILLTFMLYFIIFGFLFKLAAFPCHLWTPEVYDGAPNPITAIFVLPIKIATFGIFLRLLGSLFIDLHSLWNHLVLISSLVSMIWGGLVAVIEFQIKRFIAYSSINQMGFLLIGVVCGSFQGVQASLLYLYIYVLMNLGFFIFFLTARDKETNNSLTYITDFKYIVHNDYKMTAILVIIVFSMAGIPPLGGFFGKYYLFLAAFMEGYYSLVIVGLLMSLISTYYYLRLIKILWFSTPKLNTTTFDYQFNCKRSILFIYSMIAINIIIFLVILFDLFTITHILVRICLNPLSAIHHLHELPEFHF